jgi:hypothetical protein
MYGVAEPINEESALRESSGVLRSSRPRKSDLFASLPARNDDPRSSLFERHITEESVYSEKGSEKERGQPPWRQRQAAQIEAMAARLHVFFPEQQPGRGEKAKLGELLVLR